MSPLRKPNVAEKTPKTVRCYFEGRKELFEGRLYIYNKEKEWRKYPVNAFAMGMNISQDRRTIDSYRIVQVSEVAHLSDKI
jgi:hypothetical protein